MEQLVGVSHNLKPTDLYRKAMIVYKGTICFCYKYRYIGLYQCGYSLLILFIDSSLSFSEVVNYKIIAEEIVRTLVGSIGLILTVPIATFVTVVFLKK